jgi:T-complex protein 1 subunit zeta
MSAVNVVNPNADIMRHADATMMNVNAARGLYDVLKSNLGPKGTLKMLVGGAGDLKLTKDGNTLLHEMMIQHPTACLIARIATAQDDVAGDGTTSNVLIIGDLMKQAERYLADGLHPRLICEGIQAAKSRVLTFLDQVKQDVPVTERAFLIKVAASSLRTKLHPELADLVTEIVVDAVRCVKKDGEQLDLHMIEIMAMQHRHAAESRLVRGLVMDHGGRHPDMKKQLNNCFILTCNATLEYEKSEVRARPPTARAERARARGRARGAERKARGAGSDRLVWRRPLRARARGTRALPTRARAYSRACARTSARAHRRSRPHSRPPPRRFARALLLSCR